MLLEELMTELQPLIITACVTIVTTVATWLGAQVKTIIKDKVDTQTKKDIIETTCRYVNQVYKDLNGPAKLQKAKEEALMLLNEKGIKITDLELTVLIEATVNSFKAGYGDSILANTSTGAPEQKVSWLEDTTTATETVEPETVTTTDSE